MDEISPSSNTVHGEAYLYDTALGVTTIPAGDWVWSIYASVSSHAGTRVSTLTSNVYTVVSAGTVTTAFVSGTTATVTASVGTPFATCVADAVNPPNSTTASMVQTPKGLYQITACTSGICGKYKGARNIYRGEYSRCELLE